MVLILSASSPPSTLLASRAETSNLCDMCHCSFAQLVGPIATDYLGMNVRMKCEYEM